jgi:cell division control protein 6
MGLTNFFQEYMNKEPLFINKKVLQSNYTPKVIPHRKKEIDMVAKILAPTLRNDRPSNLFIYGKTGTGKSLVVNYVSNEINQIAIKNKLNVKIIYINCKLKRVADTEYRLFAQLSREFGGDVPATGLPTDEIYKLFIKILEEKRLLLIIILDEIDQLINKAGDEILYNLTRLNSELKNSEISIIGISNDLIFREHLDPRVKSSLSEEELVFPPYNAIQLQSILKYRAKKAFKENVLEEGVIEKCAAYAAREHGDARRALELLRVAGELAERRSEDKIKIKHIDMAEEKVERDRIVDILETQPKQFKLTLYSIFKLTSKNQSIFTGDVYEIYKDLCFKAKVAPLTQRRVSDIIAELDMLGLINAKVVSKGRYGKTREICLAIPTSTLPKANKILIEGMNL